MSLEGVKCHHRNGGGSSHSYLHWWTMQLLLFNDDNNNSATDSHYNVNAASEATLADLIYSTLSSYLLILL
jgi:hypothetical protein